MLMQVLRKGFLSVKKNKERGGRGFPPVACNFLSFSLCFLFSSSSFMMNEAKAATPPPPPPPPPPDSILNLPNVKPSFFHKKEWNFTQKPEMRFPVSLISLSPGQIFNMVQSFIHHLALSEEGTVYLLGPGPCSKPTPEKEASEGQGAFRRSWPLLRDIYRRVVSVHSWGCGGRWRRGRVALGCSK